VRRRSTLVREINSLLEHARGAPPFCFKDWG
jgi:hypothetical protein